MDVIRAAHTRGVGAATVTTGAVSAASLSTGAIGAVATLSGVLEENKLIKKSLGVRQEESFLSRTATAT